MTNIVIEKIDTQSINDLQEIGKTTFEETFSEQNSIEDLNNYLEKKFNINQLNIELNNINSSFYFAKINEKVVGYLKINTNTAQTENILNNALEIERIYVLKKYLGHKIGQKLFDQAIEVAIANQNQFVWLGVWEHNKRAIQFYEKNGLRVFDQHLFILGDDKQTDLLMKIEL